MTPAAAAPVRKQIIVEAPLERAIVVLTERLGDFKPPEHNLLGVRIAETVFEPRVGGRIYDLGVEAACADGPACLHTSHRAASYSVGTSACIGRSRAS